MSKTLKINAPTWVIAIAKKPEFPIIDDDYRGDTWMSYVGEHTVMMWDTFSLAQRCAIIMDADAVFTAGDPAF